MRPWLILDFRKSLKLYINRFMLYPMLSSIATTITMDLFGNGQLFETLRKDHNHEVQPSRDTKGRRDENHIKKKKQ